LLIYFPVTAEIIQIMGVGHFYAGEYIATKSTIPMIITDGKFKVEVLLNVTFAATEGNAVSVKVLQITPSVPAVFILDSRLFEYSEIAKRGKDAKSKLPSHGILSQLNRTSWMFTPQLSDHLSSKLCSYINRSISDKCVFNLGPRNTNVLIHVNISYLNIDPDMFLNTSSNVKIISGQYIFLREFLLPNFQFKLNLLFQNCRRKADFGFQVLLVSKHCDLRGLSADNIMWWEENWTNSGLLCFYNKEIVLTEQLLFKVVLKQHNIVYTGYRKLELSIPVYSTISYKSRIAPGAMRKEKYNSLTGFNLKNYITSYHNATSTNGFTNITSYPLLQGHHTVALTDKILQDIDLYSIESVSIWLTKYPQYGEIFLKEETDVSIREFTMEDIILGKVFYRQKEFSKKDIFQLLILNYMQYVDIEIYTKPNIVSTLPMVIENNTPCFIAVESLDASPLLHFSLKDPIYYITKPPLYGQLRHVSHNTTRDLNISIMSFTHTDIVNELIMYYPPSDLPDKRKDNFFYTLISDNISPADGVFTFMLNYSVNKSSVTYSAESSFDSSKGLSKTMLILVIVTCSSIFCALILSAIFGFQYLKTQRRRRMVKKKVLASEPKLVLTKENGSYKLLVTNGRKTCSLERTLLGSSSSQEIAQQPEPPCPESILKATPLLNKNDTCFESHDYVNCEDLQHLVSGPQDTIYIKRSGLTHASKFEDKSCDSLEALDQMPTIQKPVYPC